MLRISRQTKSMSGTVLKAAVGFNYAACVSFRHAFDQG